MRCFTLFCSLKETKKGEEEISILELVCKIFFLCIESKINPFDVVPQEIALALQ